MLTEHVAITRHMTQQGSGEAAYPYEGREDGLAADTLHRTPLTVQQEVPNIGPLLTNPKTQVNPTHEQGFGRAPGWKYGWMRKNIPYSFHPLHGITKRLGQTRTEIILTRGTPHSPGWGKWQGVASPHGYGGGPGGTPTGRRHSARGVLAPVETEYLTAAMQPRAHAAYSSPVWGEPV